MSISYSLFVLLVMTPLISMNNQKSGYPDHSVNSNENQKTDLHKGFGADFFPRGDMEADLAETDDRELDLDLKLPNSNPALHERILGAQVYPTDDSSISENDIVYGTVLSHPHTANQQPSMVAPFSLNLHTTETPYFVNSQPYSVSTGYPSDYQTPLTLQASTMNTTLNEQSKPSYSTSTERNPNYITQTYNATTSLPLTPGNITTYNQPKPQIATPASKPNSISATIYISSKPPSSSTSIPHSFYAAINRPIFYDMYPLSRLPSTRPSDSHSTEKLVPPPVSQFKKTDKHYTTFKCKCPSQVSYLPSHSPLHSKGYSKSLVTTAARPLYTTPISHEHFLYLINMRFFSKKRPLHPLNRRHNIRWFNPRPYYERK